MSETREEQLAKHIADLSPAAREELLLAAIRKVLDRVGKTRMPARLESAVAELEVLVEAWQ